MPNKNLPPILEHKHHAAPAVFLPENLLREARRQRRLPNLSVPEVCILDPDGEHHQGINRHRDQDRDCRKNEIGRASCRERVCMLV